MILGMLWYSPILFGNIWLDLVGMKAEDISKEDAAASMKFAFIPALVSAFSLALILGFIGVETITGGILIALILSLGFIGMSHINLVLFEGRSFKLTLLNTGYSLCTFLIAATVMTTWH